MHADNPSGISLNKFISDTGLCSRRQADALIREGRLCINGVVATLGNRVFQGDSVTLDGKPLASEDEKPVYILLNKPRGITCTTERHIPDNILDFVNHSRRIFPVGRLDKDSEGLIILTSDGDIVNKILRAGNQHEKEYIVTVNRPISRDFIAQMRQGVPILGTTTLPCTVHKMNAFTFRIILIQGLNRQIRRMCSYLGYEVQSLKRTRIMHLTLDHLPTGKWRDLTENELGNILKKVAHSSKTEEATRRAYSKHSKN